MLMRGVAGYYPGVPTDAVHQLFSAAMLPVSLSRWWSGSCAVRPARRGRLAARPPGRGRRLVLALIGIFAHRANLIVIGLGKAPIPCLPARRSARRRATARRSPQQRLLPVGLGAPHRPRDRRRWRPCCSRWRALPAAQGEDAGVTAPDPEVPRDALRRRGGRLARGRAGRTPRRRVRGGPPSTRCSRRASASRARSSSGPSRAARSGPTSATPWP